MVRGRSLLCDQPAAGRPDDARQAARRHLLRHYWLVLANAAAWTAWSLLTGEYAAGVPALVNGPAAIVILHRLVATRHTPRRSEFDTEVRESAPADSLTYGGNRLPVKSKRPRRTSQAASFGRL
jgi:hypothetical protein